MSSRRGGEGRGTFPSPFRKGFWSIVTGDAVVALTLSLLRVINVKIPLQPHKKYDITQYGELDFS